MTKKLSFEFYGSRYTTIPSGIKPETVNRNFFEATRLPSPVFMEPVIEDGTYDDFKSCVFRVCAARVFDVMLDDLSADLNSQDLHCKQARHEWVYLEATSSGIGSIRLDLSAANNHLVDGQPEFSCATMVELVIETYLSMADIREGYIGRFFNLLAVKYGFKYDGLIFKQAIHKLNDLGHPYPMMSPPEIEVRLFWPYWV